MAKNVAEQRFHSRLTVEECQQRISQLRPRPGVINPYWGAPRLLFGSHNGNDLELVAVSRAVHNVPSRFHGQLHRVSDGTLIIGRFEPGGLVGMLLAFIFWSMVALLAASFVAGMLSWRRWITLLDATSGMLWMGMSAGFSLLAFGLRAALERASRKEEEFVLDYVRRELNGVQIAPDATHN